ncbi:MAG TPA: hypothetical protein VFZ16_18910 [Hyphomicrobiaceae bacterium]|nr:hypothetical protein [Hyphomicrobiaceae bacterium]
MTKRHGKQPAPKRQGRARPGPMPYEQPEANVAGLEEAGVPFRGPVAELPERRVKLLKNGRSQAVRIPREFELPGKEAIVRKEGERLIIEPAKRRSLLEVLSTLEPLDEEWPEISDQLPDPVDL